MSLVYVTSNANSDTCMQISYFPQVYADKLTFTTVLDSNTNGVKDLFNNINSHPFSYLMSGNSFISAYYDNTNVIGTLKNPPISNAPTSVNLSVLDQVISVPLSGNSFSLPISVHDSVAQQKLEISIHCDGTPPVYMEIGEQNGNIPVQMYKDVNGTYHLIPQTNADLATFYENKYVNATWNIVDIETALGILFDAMFNYVFPALSNTTYTPLALNSAETSGYNDIKTNILSQIASKLDNVLPDGVTPDVHYSSYRAHIANANSAMTSYVNDRSEILKYTTLK